jgi:hypothetical protein
MNTEVLTGPVHLFTPGEAIRTYKQAAVDYYLQKPVDKVNIEILDASGKVIRTFTGTPADDKPKKEEEDSEFGFHPPKPPTRKAGLNRFQWDLRYPGSVVFEGMVLWSAHAEAGPLAVPGEYQVRLTANGVTQTQPLTLKMDPRSDVTQADLEAQFQLAMKVRDQVSAADEMVIAIRQINKELRDRADKSNDESIKAASATLRDQLTTIEEDLYQTRNRANEDPLNFPIKLNNILAALARSIETGDRRPTDQALEVEKELTARLEKVQARYNQAVGTDLSKFNAMAQQKGVKQVQVTASDAGKQ